VLLHFRLLICVQSLFFRFGGGEPSTMSWHSFVEPWRNIQLCPSRFPALWSPWRPRQHFPCFTTLRLPPDSLSLRQAPWDSRPEISFSSEPLRSVLMYHPLWKDGFISYEYVWPYVKCIFRTYSTLLKKFPFAIYTSPVSVWFAKKIMPIIRTLCYNGSLSHLNGRKLDHR
jgi:hypothetical protein